MRFKTRPKKTKALRAHARRRALQRYDIELTRTLRNEIIQKIQRNESVHLETQSNRVSVHLVNQMRVVYDRLRKEIVTVLPMREEHTSLVSSQAI